MAQGAPPNMEIDIVGHHLNAAEFEDANIVDDILPAVVFDGMPQDADEGANIDYDQGRVSYEDNQEGSYDYDEGASMDDDQGAPNDNNEGAPYEEEEALNDDNEIMSVGADEGAQEVPNAQPAYNLRTRKEGTRQFNAAMDNPHSNKSYYPPVQMLQMLHKGNPL